MNSWLTCVLLQTQVLNLGNMIEMQGDRHSNLFMSCDRALCASVQGLLASVQMLVVKDEFGPIIARGEGCCIGKGGPRIV